jgi:hypothetical protein
MRRRGQIMDLSLGYDDETCRHNAKQQADNRSDGKAYGHLDVQTMDGNGGVQLHCGLIAAHG